MVVFVPAICSSNTLRTFSLRATKSQRLFEKLRTGWVIRYCMYSNKRRGFYLRAAFIELRHFFILILSGLRRLFK